MSPRPRTVSDAAIFAAAMKAVKRAGPVGFTLAEVAEAVDLTPAALVRRFGSKRDLLLAAVRQAPAMADACFARARAAHRSPIAALIAAATDVGEFVREPEELANSLAFLQIDLTDPDFRSAALQNSKQILAGYEALVRDAIGAGELERCDARRLARAIQAVTGGSLINWAIHREGKPAAFLRRDVETLLAPLRRRIRGRKPPGSE